MKRRKFVWQSALFCGSFFLSNAWAGRGFMPRNLPLPDLAVSSGQDHFEMTRKSIQALGGIRRFVRQGDCVGLLINSDFDKPGTFVSPDIPLAVIDLCMQAGSEEICLLKPVRKGYWQDTELYDTFSGMISELTSVETNEFPAKFNDHDFVLYKDRKGTFRLPEMELVKKLFECDVFINLAIGKHNSGSIFSGSLKNMMGLTTRKTSLAFHTGGATRDDMDFLAGCIADLSLVRKPDLILSDATRVIVTNGPGGPGKTISPSRIVAGTDPVAVDTYCAILAGFDPASLLTLQYAHKSGIGTMDISRLNINEME